MSATGETKGAVPMNQQLTAELYLRVKRLFRRQATVYEAVSKVLPGSRGEKVLARSEEFRDAAEQIREEAERRGLVKPE